MTDQSFPPDNAICRDNGGGGNRTRETFPTEINYVGAWNNLAELELRTELERAISERDGDACFYCGTTRFFGGRPIDHVTPRPWGSDSVDNLVFACRTCNLVKSQMAGWYFLLRQWSRGKPVAFDMARSAHTQQAAA